MRYKLTNISGGLLEVDTSRHTFDLVNNGVLYVSEEERNYANVVNLVVAGDLAAEEDEGGG